MSHLPLNLPYRHPAVRDLAWVMVSPGLLQAAPEGQLLVTDAWCQEMYAAHEGHLHELDEQPQPLLDALAHCRSHRLGVYFEFLLAYWLEAILHVKQLRRNVPIFQQRSTSGRTTLGEFDFLFKFPRQSAIQHWEATVKFYLRQETAAGEVFWVGPGGRDRLDLKLDRLFDHQLNLALLPEAVELLGAEEEAVIQEDVKSAAFVKGYLFYPVDDAGNFGPDYIVETGLAAAPYHLSADHLVGWWVQFGTVSVPQHAAESRWHVPIKSRWLSPLCFDSNNEVLLDDSGLTAYCERYFRHDKRAFLVVEMCREEGVWLEVSRGFVMAPHSL